MIYQSLILEILMTTLNPRAQAHVCEKGSAEMFDVGGELYPNEVATRSATEIINENRATSIDKERWPSG